MAESGDRDDLREQWDTFTLRLAELHRRGCFAAGLSPAMVQQRIADAIAVPADEALVFRYGFTGSGIVDLLPGMQIQVERSVLGERGGRRELQSLQGDYEVISTSDGVRLKLIHAGTLHQSERPEEIFHLDRITAGATHIRLLLQNLNAGQAAQRPPLLLFSTDEAALRQASSQVESGGCSAVASSGGVKCITFHEAVSLLIGIHVNGKVRTYAMGAILGLVADAEHLEIADLRLERVLSDGHVAEVEFPHTREATSRIVLQAGDSILAKPDAAKH